MLHDRHGSYGPFAYSIIAADVAANADITSREAETDTRTPPKVAPRFATLRDFAASITRPRTAKTA